MPKTNAVCYNDIDRFKAGQYVIASDDMTDSLPMRVTMCGYSACYSKTQYTEHFRDLELVDADAPVALPEEFVEKVVKLQNIALSGESAKMHISWVAHMWSLVGRGADGEPPRTAGAFFNPDFVDPDAPRVTPEVLEFIMDMAKYSKVCDESRISYAKNILASLGLRPDGKPLAKEPKPPYRVMRKDETAFGWFQGDSILDPETHVGISLLRNGTALLTIPKDLYHQNWKRVEDAQ